MKVGTRVKELIYDHTGKIVEIKDIAGIKTYMVKLDKEYRDNPMYHSPYSFYDGELELI